MKILLNNKIYTIYSVKKDDKTIIKAIAEDGKKIKIDTVKEEKQCPK